MNTETIKSLLNFIAIRFMHSILECLYQLELYYLI